MKISKRSVGTMDNNAYLIVDSGEALLVDAAAEPRTLLAMAGDVPLRTIVTTHRHHDHIGALAEVAAATGARLVAGAPDVAAIASAAGVEPEGVWDGDVVTVGSVDLEVIGLVGHTPGGIALVIRDADHPVQLLTGDSLFPGGVGKTHTPEEFASLLGDVTTKLFDRFDDEAIVRPGHGADTTLGAERPQLEEWRRRGW